MWSEIEDIIEVAAAVLIIGAALWATIAKFWRLPQVTNRIVESNLLERLEALLAKDEAVSKQHDKSLTNEEGANRTATEFFGSRRKIPHHPSASHAQNSGID